MDKHVLLSGYYGFANAGDEAVCAAILQTMRTHGGDPHVTVLSADPEETQKMHGARAVSRKALFDALPSADALFQGGGSLLQDATSARSLYYYLGVIVAARIIRRPVLLYAQGMGPFHRKASRATVRTVLNRVQAICVRDRESKTLLADIGVNRPKIYQTADPVWALEPADPERARLIWERQGLPTGGKTVVFALRAWPSAPNLVETVAAAATALQQRGFDPALLPMQRPADETVGNAIRERMAKPAPMLQGGYHPSDLMALAAQADLLIGMRLHALIFAAARGIPVMGISYDPKVDSLLRELGDVPSVDAVAMNPASIVATFETAWSGREAAARRMAREVERLRDNALGTARIAKSFLETTDIE